MNLLVNVLFRKISLQSYAPEKAVVLDVTDLAISDT